MGGVGSIPSSIKMGSGFDLAPAKEANKVNGTKTNFDKIVETSTSYEGIDASLYISRETGLKVLIANVEVPVVCLNYLS
jgi:hypothetical protein